MYTLKCLISQLLTAPSRTTVQLMPQSLTLVAWITISLHRLLPPFLLKHMLSFDWTIYLILKRFQEPTRKIEVNHTIASKVWKGELLEIFRKIYTSVVTVGMVKSWYVIIMATSRHFDTMVLGQKYLYSWHCRNRNKCLLYYQIF